MTLPVGTLLADRFEIQAVLGHGGMATVYRASDRNVGVAVAVKENGVATPEAARRFEQEARLLATLRHPGLPQVIDFFALPDQSQYLVMELVDGQDAVAWRGGVPVDRLEAGVLRLAGQLVDTVRYLHERTVPVIHRDIHPGNLRIQPDGRPMLVDFGLAIVQEIDRTTTGGTRALTPGFAAPEQYGSGDVDARTDVYGLGATVYWLLAGQAPADGMARLLGHIAYTPVRDLAPWASPALAQAVDRALALAPEARYSDAAAFGVALAGHPASARPPAVFQPQAVWQRRWSRVGWGLAAVGVLGVLAALAAQPPPTPTSKPQTDVALPSPAITMHPPATSPTPVATSPTEVALASGALPTGGIVFVSFRINGMPQLFSWSTSAGDQPWLQMPGGACHPAWSPDGLRLAFVSPCDLEDLVDQQAELYVVPVDGDGRPGAPVKRLSCFGGVADLTWGTAGMAFTSLQCLAGQTTLRSHVYVWSPDEVNGTVQRLSANNARDSQPSWGPTAGELIVRNASRVTEPHLFFMDQGGGFRGASQPRQWLGTANAEQPAWSPMAGRAAYVQAGDLFVRDLPPQTTRAQQLTFTGRNADPAWTVDGQRLIYRAWPDGANNDLYQIDPAGGAPLRLTTAAGWDGQPAVRP